MNAPSEDDVILDFIARVRRMVPEFTDEQARELEMQLRRDRGGTQPYIGKDMSRRPHEKKRLREKLKTRTVDQVAKEEGISRRTIYRMLSKKR